MGKPIVGETPTLPMCRLGFRIAEAGNHIAACVLSRISFAGITLGAGRTVSANRWTDAWLAALALSLDFEMVSFDRSFRSFAGLRLDLLTV